MIVDCLYAGVDVSLASLELAIRIGGQCVATQSYANTDSGVTRLVKELTKQSRECRIVLEPTSRYHLRLLLALAATPGCQVMVINPWRARKFQESWGKRAKTDPLDAAGLAKLAEQLGDDFIAYTAPSPELRELQLLGRRLSNIVDQRAKAKCRAKSYAADDPANRTAIDSLEREIEFCQQEVKRIIGQMSGIVDADPAKRQVFDWLVQTHGIARQSALQLMAELLILPEGMGPSQWTAHAGVDPKPQQSGKHDPPARISKMGNRYLKRTLFLAAWSIVQHDEHVQEWYNRTCERKKAKMLVLVIAMRKLLHGIWWMLCRQEPLDVQKCFRIHC